MLKDTFASHILPGLLAAGLVLLAGWCSAAETVEPKSVLAQLILLEKDLDTWEAELAAQEPKTWEDCKVWLELALRAGDFPHALAAADLLVEKFPGAAAENPRVLLFTVDPYVRLAIRLKSPATARALYEKFPMEASVGNGSGDRGLIEDMPDEQALDWIRARDEAARQWEARWGAERDRLRPHDWPFRDPVTTVWRAMYWRQLAHMGRIEGEITRLGGVARENPADTAAACAYLEILSMFGYDTFTRKGQPWPDLTWIVEKGTYARALDWDTLARLLERLKLFALQEQALLRVSQGELTAGEIDVLRTRVSVYHPDAGFYRQGFTIGNYEALSVCCVKLGKHADAQRWMLEAHELRKKAGGQLNLYFAGRTQGVTGRQVVENEILQQEKLAENNPEYWSERVQYYRGRNEPKELEHALRKGLALCPCEERGEPGSESSRRFWYRDNFLGGLARLLNETDRGAECAALLLEEITNRHALPGEWSAQWSTLEKCAKHISPEEPILWACLERTEVWESREGKLVQMLVRYSDLKTKPHLLERAEKLALAEGADPSRAYYVGKLESYHKLSGRAIPMLEHALKLAEAKPDGHEKEKLVRSIAQALYMIYSSRENMPRKEELFWRYVSPRMNPADMENQVAAFAKDARGLGCEETAARAEVRLRNVSYLYRTENP